MRLASITSFLISACLVAAQNDFLVRMHTQVITEPVMDDLILVKVVSYESGSPVVVCKFSDSKFFSDNLDQFCYDGTVDGIKDGYGCMEQWGACVWDNGRQASVAYHGSPVKVWEMKMVQGDIYTYDCGPCTGNACLKCSDWEQCLDNGMAGDAPKSDCPMCDHVGTWTCLDGDESAF